jgi:CheY-like chemotaxis protein
MAIALETLMGIRILVVDDATFIRDMVKKQLRDHIPGVEVFEAPDGARALSILKTQPVDMILSDWEMPNVTGADLLRTIRAMPEAGKLPFIMISSRGDRSHIIKAIELGVSDYLTKPFTPEELHKKVYKQLKIIGKLPTLGRSTATTQGIAFASVDVLTGGRAPIATTSSPLTRDPAPAPVKAIAPVKTQGRAQLRFSNNRIFACVIREMSLQLIHCLMPRSEQLPGLFEQAVVDIETGDGGNLARVNGYVHSIQATENRPDSPSIKLVIRFVDNDAEKFETLSKYISQL